MTPQEIITLVTAHNYLALFLIVAVYCRKLTSADSKFPITLPVNWRPSVSAFFGLSYIVVGARAAGQTWLTAALMGVAAGVATGFFDGLLTAIFGDPAKAPSWAKAVVFLIDDLGGVTQQTTQVTQVTITEKVVPADPTPTETPIDKT